MASVANVWEALCAVGYVEKQPPTLTWISVAEEGRSPPTSFKIMDLRATVCVFCARRQWTGPGCAACVLSRCSAIL